MKQIRRGDVFWCDLSPSVGSEQTGVRPVLIISNNLGNHFSPVVMVAPISTSIIKHQRYKKMPTHVKLEGEKYGLGGDSIVYLEQVRVIDKLRLGDYITTLDNMKMEEVNNAITVSFSSEIDYQPQRQLQTV